MQKFQRGNGCAQRWPFTKQFPAGFKPVPGYKVSHSKEREFRDIGKAGYGLTMEAVLRLSEHPGSRGVFAARVK